MCWKVLNKQQQKSEIFFRALSKIVPHSTNVFYDHDSIYWIKHKVIKVYKLFILLFCVNPNIIGEITYRVLNAMQSKYTNTYKYAVMYDIWIKKKIYLFIYKRILLLITTSTKHFDFCLLCKFNKLGNRNFHKFLVIFSSFWAMQKLWIKRLKLSAVRSKFIREKKQKCSSHGKNYR